MTSTTPVAMTEKQKERAMRRRLIKRDWRMNKAVYLMAIPVIVYFIIFNYIPMGGILMAFQDY